jgi:hypothetical protein
MKKYFLIVAFLLFGTAGVYANISGLACNGSYSFSTCTAEAGPSRSGTVQVTIEGYSHELGHNVGVTPIVDWWCATETGVGDAWAWWDCGSLCYADIGGEAYFQTDSLDLTIWAWSQVDTYGNYTGGSGSSGGCS